MQPFNVTGMTFVVVLSPALDPLSPVVLPLDVFSLDELPPDVLPLDVSSLDEFPPEVVSSVLPEELEPLFPVVIVASGMETTFFIVRPVPHT